MLDVLALSPVSCILGGDGHFTHLTRAPSSLRVGAGFRAPMTTANSHFPFYSSRLTLLCSFARVALTSYINDDNLFSDSWGSRALSEASRRTLPASFQVPMAPPSYPGPWLAPHHVLSAPLAWPLPAGCVPRPAHHLSSYQDIRQWARTHFVHMISFQLNCCPEDLISKEGHFHTGQTCVPEGWNHPSVYA